MHPYLDTVGKLTIGYGRNLDDVGISETEASLMLRNDLDEAVNVLEGTLPWAEDLDEPRWAVLVNMTYNMGMKGLLGFKRMLDHTRAKEWNLAAREMLDSKWAGQVGDRALRLAEQMRLGAWR